MTDGESTDDSPEASVLLRQDLAAAREYVVRQNVPERARNAAIEHYAGLHAEYGVSGFRLRFGLRPPRNAIEQAEQDFWMERIDGDEHLRRVQAEEAQSIDIPTLSVLYDEIDEDLGHYGKALQTVIQIVSDQRDPDVWRTLEPEADFHVREMNRKSCFSSGRLLVLSGFLEEVRQIRGLGLAVIGDMQSATAVHLARLVLSQAAEQWSICRDTADQSHTRPEYTYATTASSLFEEAKADRPRPNDLHALLREEFAAARIVLNDRSQPAGTAPISIHNEIQVNPPSVNVSPTIVVNVAPNEACEVMVDDNMHAPPTAEKPAKEKRPDAKPTMNRWAVGMDGSRGWWLFHWYREGWRESCKVGVPGGNASAALEALANNGGSIGRDDLRTVFGPSNPGRTLPQLTDVMTDALAKAKRAIRESIAEIGPFKLDAVPNPIPWDDSSWRAVIQIGFVVTDDEGRRTFRTRDELGSADLP